MPTAVELEEVLRQQAAGFAEMLGTMHALRFTGPVTLHFLNGQPQMVELGRPHILRFPEHPANKSVDRPGSAAPFSSP